MRPVAFPGTFNKNYEKNNKEDLPEWKKTVETTGKNMRLHH